MLSAFKAEPLIELKSRDKSKIESILSHGDQLLVGLSTGSLRVYKVNSPPSRSDDASGNGARELLKRPTELQREYEKFSKYKIEQLAIFKEANILASLSGGLVSIHDLATFELQETLSKTKGASVFAATSNIVNDTTTDIPTLVSRLAVAVKRRLLLWSWHDGEITHEAQEIALTSGIKSLTWATGTKIVAGLSSHYVFVDIVSREVRIISGPGSIGGGTEQESSRLGGVGQGTMSVLGIVSTAPNPLATGLGERELLLARDINTQFIDRNGDPVRRRQIPWKSAPQAIGYSYPYLLSLQEASKGVLEVRNPETLMLLQSIDLPGATLLQVPNPSISLAHQGKGFLVSSERLVWRMKGSNYDAQIDHLVDAGLFDEAVSLLNMIEETLIEDSAGRLREIKMQKAQRLFDEKRFRESLEIFSEVLAPPERVIRMYPELISGSLAAAAARPNTSSSVKSRAKAGSISSPRKSNVDHHDDAASMRSRRRNPEELADKDLKPAVRELQSFLADIRRRLQRFFDNDQNIKDIRELQQNAEKDEIHPIAECLLGVKDLAEAGFHDKLMEIATLVDTTLFRAHMFATPSLVGPLLRIANFCDPEVVMSKLEATERYSDLIDFLYGKRLHRQALERLQKLGQDHRTEDIDSQLRGPERTITYLQNLSPEYIELILEFARWPLEARPERGMEIFIADTENAEQLPRDKVLAFLEPIDKALALQYLEHVIDELNDDTPELHQKLAELYLDEIDEAPGPAKDTLVEKLLTMLRTSTQYSPAKILDRLPRDNPIFYEITAVLFSKMGQQKQALQVYVFKLHNMAKAEEHCNEIYIEEQMEAAKKQSSWRKSSALTKDPTDERPSIYHVLLNLYLNPPKDEKALIGPAIELMAKHGPRLPASSTLEMIPKDLLVKELEFYLRGRMRHANTATNDAKIAAGLRKVDAIRVSAALLLGEDDASLDPNGGRQRKVKVDEDRVCRVCYKRLGLSVISVFPDNSVVHLGCAARRQNEIVGKA